MKTPEELAMEYLDQDEIACSAIDHAAEHLVKKAFLDGYQAAKHQLADGSKVITYDYVETATKEAEKIIAEVGLKGDENMLVKALVTAYCRGVDAVDGYLRNSLSAYRASVRSPHVKNKKETEPVTAAIRTILQGRHPDWIIAPRNYIEKLARENGINPEDLILHPLPKDEI